MLLKIIAFGNDRRRILVWIIIVKLFIHFPI